jgi:ADP-ribose pyrophosphatase YjhB (NUDIX family)
VTPTHFEQFVCCPRCAASARSPGSNPFRCVACGFVLYFNAASAVAAFILDPAGRVLYTRRASEPAKGRLGMPGGFVDIGETAEDALRREVDEEVGLAIGKLTYLASFPNRYPFAGVTYTTLDLFYVTRADDPSAARALDAVSGLEWIDPAHVDPSEIAFDSMRLARMHLLALKVSF